jgi:peroxiredoxin
MKRWNSIWVKLFAAATLMTLLAVSLAAIEVPRKAPEFVVFMPDGRQQLLSKYRGKVVVLGIILTTCPHCQDMCRIVNKLYGEYGSQGLQPLVAAIDTEADIPQFVRALGLKFPVGTTPRPQAYDFLQDEFHYVPQLVFIDRSGVIRAQHGGIDDFFKQEEQNARALIVTMLHEHGK